MTNLAFIRCRGEGEGEPASVYFKLSLVFSAFSFSFSQKKERKSSWVLAGHRGIAVYELGSFSESESCMAFLQWSVK